MLPLITDAQFNSIAIVFVAVVTIIPATLAAFWSRSAKNNSEEAQDQLRTNGGMTDPNPNVNDHIKYQTEMLEQLIERQDNSEKLLANHISHSQIMDQALSQVYLKVMPGVIIDEDENSP